MEDTTGIKSFLKKAAEKQGKQFDDKKADELIKSSNNDFGKIVDNVGLRLGFKEEEIPAFREKAFQTYQIGIKPETPVQETPRQDKTPEEKFRYNPRVVMSMPVPIAQQIAENVADQNQEDIAKWKGTGKELGLQAKSSMNDLTAGIYGAPGYMYDLIGSAFRGLGIPVPYWNQTFFTKDLKIGNRDINPLSILEKDKNILLEASRKNTEKVIELNPEYIQGVQGALSEGDIQGAIRNAFSSVTRSAAPSAAMMLTGGMSGPASIVTGATVFGSMNMNDANQRLDYGDLTRDGVLAVSAINGALEMIFERNFGSGAVGNSIKKLITRKGKDQVQQQVKRQWSDVVSDMLIKNPWMAPFGEAYEEMGTQIAQNFVNKYSGLTPEISIVDGVIDAGILGTVAGSAHGAVIKSIQTGMKAAGNQTQRYQVKKQYQKATEALYDIPNDLYTEAVTNLVQNTNDINELTSSFNELSKQYDVSQENYIKALYFLSSSVQYNQMNQSRKDNVQSKINEIQDDNGNVTSAVIDGEVWYVQNVADINKEGAAIFAKNDKGERRFFSSDQITKPSTSTPEQITEAVFGEDEQFFNTQETSIQFQQQAAEKGIQVDRTAITPQGKGKVTSINDDGTITVQIKEDEEIQVNINEAEPYLTSEQKAAQNNLEQLQEDNKEIINYNGQDYQVAGEQIPGEISLIPINEEGEPANKDTITLSKNEFEQVKKQKQQETDLDQLTPEERFKQLLSDDEEIAAEILKDDIAGIRKEAKQLRSDKKGTPAQKVANLKRAKELEGEATRLEEVLNTPANQRLIDQAETLAVEFEQEKQNTPYQNLTEWQKLALGQTFSTDSFTRFGDENEITQSLAKSWLKKDGQPIDTFVSEQNYNREEGGTSPVEPFTEDDLINFIIQNPNKNVRSTTDRMNEIRAEYKELTGESIDNHEALKEKIRLQPTVKVQSDDPQAQAFNEAIDKLKEAGLSEEEINKVVGGQQEQTETIEEEFQPVAEEVPFRTEVDQPETKSSELKAEESFLNISELAQADLKQRKNAHNALIQISDELQQPAEIINSTEIPENIKAQERRLAEGAKGVAYYNPEEGKIYIISDRIKSVAEAKKSYIHELIIHKGLRGLFAQGNQEIIGRQYAKFDALMLDVFNSMDDQFKQAIGNIYLPGIEITDYSDQQKSLIAEEYLAHLSELEIIPTKWQDFINRLVQIIRKTFNLTSKQFTETDLFNIIREQRQRLASQKLNVESQKENAKTRFQAVWHGSPHTFDRFSLDKVGTGEGMQAYGWGLYFTDKQEIAQNYAGELNWNSLPEEAQTEIDQYIQDVEREANLSGIEISNEQLKEHQNHILEIAQKYNHGRNIYKVKIHGDKTVDELNFLRWDKQIPLQTANKIIEGLSQKELDKGFYYGFSPNRTGENIYRQLAKSFGGTYNNGDKKASLHLLEKGFDGIQYPTGYKTEGTHENSFNYVVFDENAVEIEDHIRFRTEVNREQFQNSLEEKYPGLKLFLGGRGDQLKLSQIELPKDQQGKGIGTQVINEITNYADQNDLTVSLTPSTDYGATSVGRLKKFYKRFGFVENKGRNKDFTISDSMIRTPQNEVRFKILGEWGALGLDRDDEVSTRLDNLEVARQMLSDGKDAKAIKLATGWEQGIDDQWRYEIPDGDFIPVVQKMIDQQRKLGIPETWGLNYPRKVSQIIADEQLFSAYPDIADIPVNINVNPENKNTGSYKRDAAGLYPKNEELVVSAKDFKSARSILNHEIQHVIQDLEGFAQGGSIDKIKRMHSELMSGIDFYNDLLTKASNEGKKELYDKLMIEKLNKVYDILKIEGKGGEGPYQAYRRLSGEVEARNVQTRENMTPEERINSLLEQTEDVSRKDQIMIKDGINQALQEPLIRFRTREEIEQLKQDNKFTFPKIITENIFLNPIGAISKEQYKSIESQSKDNNIPVRNINVSNIIPTQRNITINNLEDTETVDELPELIEYDGKYFVVDGHHRIANKILDGNSTVKAKVYSSDQNIQFRTAQTSTPEFKKWFGDSKVVDENGRPLVVYHGTDSDKDFNIFKKSSDGGYYFTDNHTVAEDYGHQIKKVYLSLKNPAIIEAKGQEWKGEIADKILDEISYYANNDDAENDGIIVKNVIDPNESDNEGIESDIYIVFSPTQIKSATGNIGSFDPNNPDIRFKIQDVSNNALWEKLFYMTNSELVEFANKRHQKAIPSEKEYYKRTKQGKIYVEDMWGKRFFTAFDLKNQLYHFEKDKIVAENNKKVKEYLQNNGFRKTYVNKEESSSYWMNDYIQIRISDHYNQSILHPDSDVNSYTELEDGYKDIIRQIEEKTNEAKKEEPTSASLNNFSTEALTKPITGSANVGTNFTSNHNVLKSDDSNVNNNSETDNTRFKVDQAASETELNPSEEQKEAGNYKMGHVSFDGFNISIENPKGSVRSGVNEQGEAWSNVLPADYGYFKGTVGKDKDHIDTFIGPNPELNKVYVVDQINPNTGKFDEHKVMLGFNSISEARNTYNAAYSQDWKGLGNITRTSKQELKDWFESGNKKKPFSESKSTESPTQPLQETINLVRFNVDEPKYFLNEVSNQARKAYANRNYKKDLKETIGYIREFWQDINLPIRKLEEEVQKRGGTIWNRSKPYRDINLSFGRIEELYRQFTEDKMTPILEAISNLVKSGKDAVDVLPYIIAKHATERNREMRMEEYNTWLDSNEESTEEERKAKREELEKKDYSGVSGFNRDENGKIIDQQFEGKPDELAQVIVEEFEQNADQELIDNLWSKINNATTTILDHWKQGGQISESQYTKLKEQYKYFVPLRGWRQGAAKQLRYHSGQGFGASLRHAEGRTSLADNPLAYLQSVAFKSIGEQVQNEINRSLLNLVMKNYDREKFGDLYSVKKVFYIKSQQYNPETGENEEVWEPTLVQPTKEQIDNGEVKTEYYREHMKLRSNFESGEHEVLIHRGADGDVVVVFDNKMLGTAQAFNRQNNLFELFGKIYDAQDLNRVSRITSGLGMTNFMKGMFTSLNPVFPFTNAFRDIPEAAFSLYIQDANKKVVKNIPSAMATVKRKLTGKVSKDNELDQKLQDFYEVGGATGFTHEKTPEQIEKELEKELKKILNKEGFKGKTVGTIGKIYDIIQKWNQLFEDTTRFAVYLSSLEAGKSKEDAALDAKEASVNFNRKGKGTKLFDSLWAFFNVAIQSLQKNFKLAKDQPVRFTKVATTVTALGFIEAMINDMMGGDDDDYYKINDYVRQNYAVLGWGNNYLRIPLPQFWRGFHSLGVITYDLAFGKTKLGKGLADTFLNFAAGLSPIDPGGFYKDGEFSIAPLVPTWYKPFQELEENRNFIGSTIYKEPFTKALEEQLASSTLHKRNVNPAIKAITDFLAKDIGGRYGDLKINVKDGELTNLPWYLDINPSKLEHLLKSYTGGTGRVLTDFTTTLSQMVLADEELDIDNIPFLNSFIRKTPDDKWEIINQWYNYKDQAAHFEAVQQESKKLQDADKYESIEGTKADEVFQIVDHYDKEISKIIKAYGMYSEEGTEAVTEIMTEAVKQMDELTK